MPYDPEIAASVPNREAFRAPGRSSRRTCPGTSASGAGSPLRRGLRERRRDRAPRRPGNLEGLVRALEQFGSERHCYLHHLDTSPLEAADALPLGTPPPWPTGSSRAASSPRWKGRPWFPSRRSRGERSGYRRRPRNGCCDVLRSFPFRDRHDASFRAPPVPTIRSPPCGSRATASQIAAISSSDRPQRFAWLRKVLVAMTVCIQPFRPIYGIAVAASTGALPSTLVKHIRVKEKLAAVRPTEDAAGGWPRVGPRPRLAQTKACMCCTPSASAGGAAQSRRPALAMGARLNTSRPTRSLRMTALRHAVMLSCGSITP